MEDEYILAIKKLDELEDAEIFYLIANHFRSRGDGIKMYEEFIRGTKDEH